MICQRLDHPTILNKEGEPPRSCESSRYGIKSITVTPLAFPNTVASMGNQHSHDSRHRPNNAVAPMGNQQHHRLIPNNSVASMDTQEPPRRFLNNAVVPLGNQQSRRLIPNNSVAPMDIQEPPRRIPNIRFRVLIIGRANAGKTSILQRVCNTRSEEHTSELQSLLLLSQTPSLQWATDTPVTPVIVQTTPSLQWATNNTIV